MWKCAAQFGEKGIGRTRDLFTIMELFVTNYALKSQKSPRRQLERFGGAATGFMVVPRMPEPVRC